MSLFNFGRGGGKTFLPEIMYKQYIWNFTSYLPVKVTKFLNSIHDICPKMPEFYIRPMSDRKIFFRDFFLGGGGVGQRPSPVRLLRPEVPSSAEQLFSWCMVLDWQKLTVFYKCVIADMLQIHWGGVCVTVCFCLNLAKSDNIWQRHQENNKVRHSV